MEGKFEAALARIDAAIWKLRQPYSPPLDAPWFPTCHPQIPIKEVTNPHLISTSLKGAPIKMKLPNFKEVKLPNFKGGDPTNWILGVEHFFEFYGISDAQKLKYAWLGLSGSATLWYYKHIKPRIHEISWSLFLEKLIDQFDSTELEDSNKSMVVDEENVIDDVSCEKNRNGVVFDSLENLEMENYRSDKSSKVFDELENQGKEKLIDQFGILEIEVDDAELGRKIQEDVVVEDCDVVEGENQKDDKAAVALDEKPSIVAISIDGGALKGLFSSTLLPLSNLVSVVGGHFILDNEIVMKAFGVPKSYMKLLFLMQTVAKSTVERRLCFDPGGSGPEMSSSVGKSSAAMSHSYMQGKLQGLGANHFVDATQASLILLANAKKQLVSGMELNNRFSEIRFVRLSVIKNLINGDTLSGLSSATFRYPRGKLLDIYRKQRALPVFDKIPEGIEDVPQITQSSTVVPLAFVIPDAEEGDRLGDISKGKITGGNISHSIEKKGPVKDGVIDFGGMSLRENTEKPLTNSVMYSASPDSDTGLLDEELFEMNYVEYIRRDKVQTGPNVLAVQPRYTAADIDPLLPLLIPSLSAALQFPDSQENQYVMKCIMRVLKVANLNGEVAKFCVNGLSAILVEVCKNPKSPTFNHYLFEAIAALIGRACEKDPSLITDLELRLFPVLFDILVNDISEFWPYAFQIFAQLIEMSRPPLTANHMQLFEVLLNPDSWKRSANVPALVKLLQAYLRKVPNELHHEGRLAMVLGIFNKLITNKTTEEQGFFVLNTVVENLGYDMIQPYIGHIWTALFTRLQNRKVSQFVKPLVIFMSLLLVKHGPGVLSDSINTVQPNLFLTILQQFWIPNLKLISGFIESKLASVASTRLICEHPSFLDPAAVELCGKMLDSIIACLAQPVKDEVDEADEKQDIPENVGYSASFARLHNAGKEEQDPLKEINDPKEFLVASLARVSAASPGRYPGVIEQYVEPQNRAFLLQLCGSYNRTIV